MNGSYRGWGHRPTGMGRPHKELLPTDEANHSPRLGLDSPFGKENLEIHSSPLTRGDSDLRCYTCVKRVREPEFTDHLFFGDVECTKCLKKINSCRDFQENINCISNTCKHTFVFRSKPSEYLSIKIQDDLPSGSSFEFDLLKEMSSYISALKELERKHPWKHALHDCHEYLTGEKTACHDPTYSDLCYEDLGVEGDFLLSQPYSLEHLDKAVEYQVADEVSSECLGVTDPERTDMRKVTSEKQLNTAPSASALRDGDGAGPPNTFSNRNSYLLDSKEKSKSRKMKSPVKQTYKHSIRLKTTSTSHTSEANTPDSAIQIFLQMPEDGYYLVVHQAIEECPMCYTELCPSRFTLNYETFLITGVCTGCKLTIFIVFHPPNGFPPKVSIVRNSRPSFVTAFYFVEGMKE